MWNKEQNSSARTPQQGAPPPAPVAAPQPAAPVQTPAATGRTVIGESMRIKGEVKSKEELHLNGELDGSLEVSERLTIGPKGKAKANIKAREIDVAGSVQGNVDAKDRITLRKGANLVGDVKTAGIVIEDGAYFKGGIDIARPATAGS